MRVLQIVNYYYPHIGGIEQTAGDISRIIKSNKNNELEIICFNEKEPSDFILIHKTEDVIDDYYGTRIIRCGCIAKILSQSISLTLYERIRESFKLFNPDVVILHMPNPLEAFLLLKCIPKKVKLIVYWHSDIYKQRFLNIFVKKLIDRLLVRANKIIATSPNYINESNYLKMYFDKCVVVPSCIDENKLIINKKVEENSIKIRSIYSDKIICFACGRHVKYKGFEYLIKAFDNLPDYIELVIAGEGPLTKKLKKMTDGNNRIHYVGRIEQEMLNAYYNVSDIFCFPSITKNEAYGLSLAEAMYFGIPSITFNINGSGVNFVSINKTTGIEIENRNIEKYREGIILLSNNKELRKEYGKNAKKRATDLFLYSKYKKSIEAIVKDICDE